jgi:Domain of unknown function (DUF6946)
LATFYGYRRLTVPDDWAGLAGDGKWVPGRSAFELAHAWQEAGGLPLGIRAALDRSGQPALAGLRLDLCLVEKPVFLDTQRAPSMTDLMGYGRNRSGEAVVAAVEGKADEPFALPVSSWVRGDHDPPQPAAVPRPSRLRRLEFLAKHLGFDVDPESRLRYQLLHRTTSAILEAKLHGAVLALVIVHVFGEHWTTNWPDFAAFAGALGSRIAEPGKALGPLLLGDGRDLPTYLLWFQDVRPAEAVGSSKVR